MSGHAGSDLSASAGGIRADRACVGCGYNLRGLTVGQRCPECGTPIREAPSSRLHDSLTDAPMGYLRAVTAGLALLGFAAAGSIANLVMTAGSSFFGAPPALRLLIGGAVAAAWALGGWVVTARRPLSERIARDPLLDSPSLRLAVRVAVLLPIGTVALGGVNTAATGLAGQILAVLAGGVTVLALFGLVPVAAYLSALADWAGDTDVGTRLRGSAWLIAVCGSVTALGVPLVAVLKADALFFPIVLALTGLGAFAGLVLCSLGVLELVGVGLWAMRNAASAREREVRIAERQAREAEEAAARREAGMVFSDTPPQAPDDADGADEPENAAAYRPVRTCGGCGYDLAGLGPAGRCPECGAGFGGGPMAGPRREDAAPLDAVPLAEDPGPAEDADGIDRALDELGGRDRAGGAARPPGTGSSKIRHHKGGLGKGFDGPAG